MAIARVKKQAVGPKRKPKDPIARMKQPVQCAMDGRWFDASHQEGHYILPSLLDPTIYLCDKRCYDDWLKAGQPKAAPREKKLKRDLPPPLF